MSPLLIALLGVMLVPLFIATWRSSLFGLASQGALLTFIAFRLQPHPSTPEEWLTIVDLALVRTVLAPLALYTVLARRNAPARSDVIPPNLLSWTMAFGLVLVAFSFSERLVSAGGDPQVLVAVASAGLLLGFFVLASQSAPFSQMIGALRIENAVALLVLGGPKQESPVVISVLLLVLFITTIALFRWYLSTLTATESGNQPTDTGSEGPVL